MPDTSSIVIPIDPQTVDAEKAAALQKQYGADLEKTRGALSQVQGQRQDVTTRNLGAIDEAIQALKNSRQTGPIAFDPAVSAAMAAGFLKTTPGVAGNFMTELGGAMGNAAPVIANKLGRDRDSFQILADLQTKRGEFEAKPLQEQQKTLEEREKEQAAGLRTVDQATLKGATTSERNQQRQDIETAKRIEEMQKQARADAEAARKGKEDMDPNDFDLLQRDYLQNHINTHNAQPGAVQINHPTPLTPDEKTRVTQIKQGMEEKGMGERKVVALKGLSQEVENRVPKNYGTEIWNNLDPKHQQALIAEALAQKVADYNRNIDDPKKRIDVPPFSQADADAARAAAHATRNVGTPDEQTIRNANLPIKGAPSPYAGLTFEERKKQIAEQQSRFDKDMAEQRGLAEKLQDRKQQAEIAQKAFDETGWKGPLLGRVPAELTGSAARQELEKIVRDLGMTNVPHGQGSISDADRKIIAGSNPSAMLQPEAFNAILKTYVGRAQMANDYTAFAEQWFSTFKTQTGMREAWNRYLSDPRSAFLTSQNGNIRENPTRLGWREFFGQENAGPKPEGRTWNPALNGGKGGYE